MTARQIIETRLGRSLGPVATMQQDLRRAQADPAGRARHDRNLA